MSTALITGCSSGFGLETAKLFLAKGWNVIATMRTPDATLFPESDKLMILRLDITSEASIADVVTKAGAIDLLVNNAGLGAAVPVELNRAAINEHQCPGHAVINAGISPINEGEKIRGDHQCFFVCDHQSGAADWTLSRQ